MTKQNLRLLDANLNRLTEGIRVVEDIFRYILNDKEIALRLKSLRHKARLDNYNDLLNSRDIKNDVLKKSTTSEQTREDLKSCLAICNEYDIELRAIIEYRLFPVKTVLLMCDLFYQAAVLDIYDVEHRIAGGAVIPLFYGYLSGLKSVGSTHAYSILVIAYLVIYYFAVRAYKFGKRS